MTAFFPELHPHTDESAKNGSVTAARIRIRPVVDHCRGRDDNRWSPPAQIRTSASTHTALTKNERRKSVHRDRGAERGVEESTGSRLGSNVPNTSLRADCGGPEHSAIAGTREV